MEKHKFQTSLGKKSQLWKPLPLPMGHPWKHYNSSSTWVLALPLHLWWNCLFLIIKESYHHFSSPCFTCWSAHCLVPKHYWAIPVLCDVSIRLALKRPECVHSQRKPYWGKKARIGIREQGPKGKVPMAAKELVAAQSGTKTGPCPQLQDLEGFISRSCEKEDQPWSSAKNEHLGPQRLRRRQELKLLPLLTC
jgi:hypothetical protein